MSPERRRRTLKGRDYAPLFAALGDETRLTLIAKLSRGRPQSIAELTQDSNLTRQAVTKHLRILEGVGIVHSAYSGRENRFELDTRPFRDIGEYLRFVSEEWDQALSRLKTFVES